MRRFNRRRDIIELSIPFAGIRTPYEWFRSRRYDIGNRGCTIDMIHGNEPFETLVHFQRYIGVVFEI